MLDHIQLHFAQAMALSDRCSSVMLSENLQTF